MWGGGGTCVTVSLRTDEHSRSSCCGQFPASRPPLLSPQTKAISSLIFIGYPWLFVPALCLFRKDWVEREPEKLWKTLSPLRLACPRQGLPPGLCAQLLTQEMLRIPGTEPASGNMILSKANEVYNLAGKCNLLKRWFSIECDVDLLKQRESLSSLSVLSVPLLFRSAASRPLQAQPKLHLLLTPTLTGYWEQHKIFKGINSCLTHKCFPRLLKNHIHKW